MIRRSSGQRSRSRQNERPSWTWLMFKVAADCVHKVSAQPKLTKLLFKRPAALHWIKCQDGEFSWTYSDQPYSADLHMPVLTLSAETHICTHTKSNHTHTREAVHTCILCQITVLRGCRAERALRETVDSVERLSSLDQHGAKVKGYKRNCFTWKRTAGE